jgi:ketosteroid isomerase-like protein
VEDRVELLELAADSAADLVAELEHAGVADCVDRALADLGLKEQTVSEEPTIPDLAERWRQANEAFVRRDFAALMSFFAPDAVWDLSSAGIGRFEGVSAIRGFHEDWIGSYGDYENQVEAWDLGNDVSFGVLSLHASPADSARSVQEQWGFTVTWEEGMIVRVIGSRDIDQARATAERLAEERA